MFRCIYKDFVINVWTVKFGSSYKMLTFLSVNNTTKSFAYFLLVQIPRNLRLKFHNFISPSLFYLFRNIVD